MPHYSIGIDIGSVAVKGILFDGSPVKAALVPTGWNPREAVLSFVLNLV